MEPARPRAANKLSQQTARGRAVSIATALTNNAFHLIQFSVVFERG